MSAYEYKLIPTTTGGLSFDETGVLNALNSNGQLRWHVVSVVTNYGYTSMLILERPR